VSPTPAEIYEQCLVPAIFAPWALKVVRAHPPKPGSRVLDVACGTGIGARSAAALVGRTGRVDGLDADAGMLAVARTTRAREGDAPIAWHQASALELPFEAGRFDVVLCFEGLQFVPDRAAALGEIRRVLRPGGAFVGTVWGPLAENPAYEALAVALRRFVSEDAARLPPFALTDAEAVRTLVRAAGFAEVDLTLERLSFTAPSAELLVDWVAAGGPTLRHNLAQLPPARRRELSELVATRLAPYRTGAGLSLPSARNVIVAR
jgi:ubiquinone/menaquinone biosynthesis C-methylase UbiE